MGGYIILGIIVFIFGFSLYLILDLMSTRAGANAFMDKWVGKTLWVWLPFYALQRLIKDVILGQGKK